jgi:ATP:corrinoid adenosyltransferase
LTEVPPTTKPYEKPTGERRGLLTVNTDDGKGKTTATAIADTVTEMNLVKRAFKAGIPAQQGIEH